VKPVLSLLRNTQYAIRNTIKGIAHITGGAFYDKIARILPGNVDAKIDKGSWMVPEIFRLIESRGNVPSEEMYRTFNMGIGMVLLVEPGTVDKIKLGLAKFNLRSWVIGEVIKGNGKVKIV
jgi:phosphoribosylformylglycinamidine cyclo-ligase